MNVTVSICPNISPAKEGSANQIPRDRLSLGAPRSRGDAEDGLGFALEGLWAGLG